MFESVKSSFSVYHQIKIKSIHFCDHFVFNFLINIQFQDFHLSYWQKYHDFLRFSDTPRGWLKYFRLADRSLWAAGNVLSGRLLQSAYPFSGRLSLFGTFFSFPDQNLAPQHLRKRRGLHLYSPPSYWWPSRKRPYLISIQV